MFQFSGILHPSVNKTVPVLIQPTSQGADKQSVLYLYTSIYKRWGGQYSSYGDKHEDKQEKALHIQQSLVYANNGLCEQSLAHDLCHSRLL